MLPCFDPTHWPDLGLVFSWKMEGIRTLFAQEIIAASVNLMLGF